MQVWQILLYEIALGTIIGAVIGYVARKVIRLSEHWRLVDRESFVVHYVALALMSMGANVLLGSDDLLAAFAAGTAFAWDGWFSAQTESSNFSAIVDLLFNTATFIFLGAMMPFGSWVDPDTTLNIWRLFVVAILTLLLKRIPIMVGLWKYVPDIKTFRDALFVGHFGPMGCGAIFISTLGRTLLPEETPHPPTHPNHYLANSMIPITYFLVLCSIAVHGLTVPFFSAARNSTKRLHHTISQGGLGARTRTLELNTTATWESWANRALGRFKTFGSEKAPAAHAGDDVGDSEGGGGGGSGGGGSGGGGGGMDEIRRVLASQLHNQRTPEGHRTTEGNNDEESPEGSNFTYGAGLGEEDAYEAASGSASASAADAAGTKGKYATTPLDSQNPSPNRDRAVRADADVGPDAATAGAAAEWRVPGLNPMHQRTISFARHDTYDDIEDTAADADANLDPGEGDWDVDENDAELRRIRHHAYLMGANPPNIGRAPSARRVGHSDSLPQLRPTSRLRTVREKAGAAVRSLGSMVLPDHHHNHNHHHDHHRPGHGGSSGSSQDEVGGAAAPTSGPSPLRRLEQFGEQELESERAESEHAREESERHSHEAEEEVDRPSMDPEEEDGTTGNNIRYPTVREWVEGRKLVLEYLPSRLAEPRVSVIAMDKDDEESWADERRSAHELGQSEPSPAWRWVCDHKSELEILLPDLDPAEWTPHNARFELVKHQVPTKLAQRRKELGLQQKDSSVSAVDWISSHLTRGGASRSEGDKAIPRAASLQHINDNDGDDADPDEPAEASRRAQLLLAAQQGVGSEENQDTASQSYEYGGANARLSTRAHPQMRLSTASSSSAPSPSPSISRSAQQDPAGGDVGLSRAGVHDGQDREPTEPLASFDYAQPPVPYAPEPSETDSTAETGQQARHALAQGQQDPPASPSRSFRVRHVDLH